MKLFGGAAASPDALDLHLAQDDEALRSTWNAVRDGHWEAARELMASTRSDFPWAWDLNTAKGSFQAARRKALRT
ncbi:hypothetical protein [Actinomadura sp. HBU206391]|uniref:hypothetical protein n=1 Tax=Actinomadura sp. HBU206391 TaxID=2731692 RepID=UPI00164FBA4A|nr:hypothetical protein [Actinomadura sp. HBU206391]MBC6461303.1 hypothetical protein [Actinomadura sp. HBU206391]